MGRDTRRSKRKELSEYDSNLGKNRRIMWCRSTKAQKSKQSVDGRRKYELVAKVLAGESNRTTAIAAGIDKGLLYSWVRCYKMKGYQGLVAQRQGRPPKEPDMRKKIEPTELTPSEREEMIRLRAENERLRAEIAVVKKRLP